MEFVSCIKNFPKHCKTAFQSIIRNGVMSVSSIFAVMITLILIAVIGVTAINIQDMTYAIEDSLTIYVKMERSVDDKEAAKAQELIEEISGVKSVEFSTKDQELDKLIEKQSDDGKSLFESYRENNPLGSAYIIEVHDSKKIDTIADQIRDIENVNDVYSGGESTSSLVGTLENVRNFGAIFVIALVIIALFMISNTIKMTITSRQTEISIMRMVGASNWFIRLPYMLEGIFIGIIGAIIPVIMIVFGYDFVYQSIQASLPAILVLRAPTPFVYEYSLLLVALGSGVGLIGSFLSVRKFLKF